METPHRPEQDHKCRADGRDLPDPAPFGIIVVASAGLRLAIFDSRRFPCSVVDEPAFESTLLLNVASDQVFLMVEEFLFRRLDGVGVPLKPLFEILLHLAGDTRSIAQLEEGIQPLV